ncbi:MAG: DUF4058 domain-containing protein [Blastocatellia bacterium]
MALQDHFHPPLSAWRHWHSFHNGWAYNLADDLNKRLPQGWFAEPNVQFGIEIDVATMEERSRAEGLDSNGSQSLNEYVPPMPVKTIPIDTITEVAEVAIYDSTAGPVLAGAIELVSPSNKDRLVSGEAFVSKCVTYLRQGLGLVIIDIVTNRTGNLHAKLMARLGETPHISSELYTVSYHPVEIENQPKLDIWEEPLVIGQLLPTMPLWLRGGLCFPIDLDASYQRTCQGQRIITNGY